MGIYGKELIIDLSNCDPSTFNRDSIEGYFKELCDDVIYMEREDLHFWDYEDDPEGYAVAEPHLKGTSAVQFIKTSNIVIHTLEDMRNVYLNIFSCKDFNDHDAVTFSERWFKGEAINIFTVNRIK